MNGRNVVALAGTYAGVTGIRAQPGHVRRPPGADHVGQRRQHESQPVHAERLRLHALQPDDRLQSAAAGCGAGDPHPDAQLLRRVRAHRRQPGEHRVEGGDRTSSTERPGNSTATRRSTPAASSRRASRSRSRIRQARAPAARSSATSCSGSAPISGCGIAARRDRARPSFQPMRSAPATSPRSAPQLRNPVNPITNAPFTDSSGAPCVSGNIIRAELHQPGVARAAPAVRALVGDAARS